LHEKFWDFLETPELDLKLITCRTIEQGVALVKGKFTKEYESAVSKAYLDPQDMDVLGICEGTLVDISSKHGRVTLEAAKSEGRQRGILVVPIGPFANVLIGNYTRATGMPLFKGISVKVKKSTKPKTTIKEILRKVYV
jgi:formylmethanofuran dehydrogenase subunit D